jgi:hypothetical protein
MHWDLSSGDQQTRQASCGGCIRKHGHHTPHLASLEKKSEGRPVEIERTSVSTLDRALVQEQRSIFVVSPSDNPADTAATF